MNNEQTKTPGQIAYEAFDSAQDLGDHEHWYQQPPTVQGWWEASASAVISHVLQGAKYVLLEVDQFHQQGDECLTSDEGWQPVQSHWFGKIVGSGPPCRRLISLPSSVRPEGKSEGPSTAPPASSGAAGADVRPVYHKEHYDSSCPKCGGLVGAGMTHECPLPSEPVAAEEKPENIFKKGMCLLTSERNQLKDTIDVMTGQLRGARDAGDRAKIEVRAAEAERDQLRKELEGARGAIKALQNSSAQDREAILALDTENAALKERVKDEAVRCGNLLEELTRLRSQSQWTPVSERMPTEKDVDAKGRVLWIGFSGWVYYTFWDWSKAAQEANKVVGWMSVPTAPLPTPETEEQTMRREFEEWATKNSLPTRREVDGDYSSNATVYAWIGYQAAKSTGGQA